MGTEIWVNIGSSNGLLPDDTKPLPEPMLTYHYYGPVTFIWGHFCKRYLSHQSLKLPWKLLISNFIQISQGSMARNNVVGDIITLWCIVTWVLVRVVSVLKFLSSCDFVWFGFILYLWCNQLHLDMIFPSLSRNFVLVWFCMSLWYLYLGAINCILARFFAVLV